MKILLTGATGFCGGEILRQLPLDDSVSEINVLTRKVMQIHHHKLKVSIHNNFLDYTTVDFTDIDACIWCLGVSQTQVDEASYIVITHDYAINAAKEMFKVNKNLRFCFLSGRNADQTEIKEKQLYRRIKGRTEKHLNLLGGDVYIFQPGYIKPTVISGPRKDFARFITPIASLISLLVKDFSVDCDKLAACLIDVAKHGSNTKFFTNNNIVNWEA